MRPVHYVGRPDATSAADAMPRRSFPRRGAGPVGRWMGHMATDENIGQICLQEIASIWQVDAAAVKWVDGRFD